MSPQQQGMRQRGPSPSQGLPGAPTGMSPQQQGVAVSVPGMMMPQQGWGQRVLSPSQSVPGAPAGIPQQQGVPPGMLLHQQQMGIPGTPAGMPPQQQVVIIPPGMMPPQQQGWGQMAPSPFPGVPGTTAGMPPQQGVIFQQGMMPQHQGVPGTPAGMPPQQGVIIQPGMMPPQHQGAVGMLPQQQGWGQRGPSPSQGVPSTPAGMPPQQQSVVVGPSGMMPPQQKMTPSRESTPLDSRSSTPQTPGSAPSRYKKMCELTLAKIFFYNKENLERQETNKNGRGT